MKKPPNIRHILTCICCEHWIFHGYVHMCTKHNVTISRPDSICDDHQSLNTGPIPVVVEPLPMLE